MNNEYEMDYFDLEETLSPSLYDTDHESDVATDDTFDNLYAMPV